MDSLTPRQTEILRFLERYAAAHGRPPTRADIVAAFGFRSPTAAEDHLRALARKGAIELTAGAARGIRLREPHAPRASGAAKPARAANDGYSLPLIGRVAAGAPLLAVENIEAQHRVDPALFAPRADYLLRVRGASMQNAGILDGDLLAVHRTHEARNGQIVVARMNDEVTVKRFQRVGDVVRLLPANPDYAPIRIDLAVQELAIEGLAVGVLRTGGLGARP